LSIFITVAPCPAGAPVAAFQLADDLMLCGQSTAAGDGQGPGGSAFVRQVALRHDVVTVWYTGSVLCPTSSISDKSLARGIPSFSVCHPFAWQIPHTGAGA